MPDFEIQRAQTFGVRAMNARLRTRILLIACGCTQWASCRLPRQCIQPIRRKNWELIDDSSVSVPRKICLDINDSSCSSNSSTGAGTFDVPFKLA